MRRNWASVTSRSACNGPDYEVNGIEMQVVWAATENLTIQGSAAFNDSKLTNSPALINNNPASPTFGEPIDTTYLGQDLARCRYRSLQTCMAIKGDPLANSPETSG